MIPKWLLPLISLSFVVLSIAMVAMGRVWFIGVLLLWIAPTFFLIGICGLLAIVVPTRRVGVRILLFAILILTLGINTSILALLKPLSKPTAVYPSSPIALGPGNWVQLETNVEELRARWRPLEGPVPECDDGCFTSDGFRMPFEHEREFNWWESVEASLLQAGISLSGHGPPSAYLRVSEQRSRDRRYMVRIEMLDVRKQVVGSATEEYRTGLPGAPPDGARASFFDYLRLSNAVALYVSSLAGYSNPYPVQRFVDKAFAVKNSPANASTVITLDIDPERPVPAESMAQAGMTTQSLRLYDDTLVEDCKSLFEQRNTDFRTVPDIIDGRPAGMWRGWSPFSASQLPLVFARDRSGKLVAYSLENAVRFRCHDASIYAMTDRLEDYVGQQMRVARFDQQGIANVIITAKVKNPRGEWSQIDPDSLRFTDTAATFTRWYWNTDTHAVTRRQQIELDLHDPTRRVKPFPGEPPTNST